MTPAQIIREPDSLPPAGLAEAGRHTKLTAKRRQLSGEELGVLAPQIIDATDAAGVELLEDFYGDE